MTETNQEKSEHAGPEPAHAEQQPMLPQEQVLTETLVRSFEEALETKDKRAYEHWGFALFHSLSPDRAQRQLLSLGLKPRDALDHYNVGCLQAAEGKFSDAAKSFAAAAGLNAGFQEAIFNLALAQEKVGNLNEARKHWKELVNLVDDEEEQGRIKQHLKEMPGA